MDHFRGANHRKQNTFLKYKNVRLKNKTNLFKSDGGKWNGLAGSSIHYN